MSEISRDSARRLIRELRAHAKDRYTPAELTHVVTAAADTIEILIKSRRANQQSPTPGENAGCEDEDRPSGPWLPIESAPKDGSDILIWMARSCQQFVAYWNAGANGWSFAQHGGTPITLYDGEEKRWMPLPKGPGSNANGGTTLSKERSSGPQENAGDVVERMSRAMMAVSRPNADPDALTPAPRGMSGSVPKWHLFKHLAEAALASLNKGGGATPSPLVERPDAEGETNRSEG